MFTQTSEYALRAIAWLAGHPDRINTTGEIAEGTQVPVSYLSKVLQALARAGLVRSQRGLGGGFSLARPAEELTVLDVIEVVDPLPRIERCPLGAPCHGEGLCKLHASLEEAMSRVEDCLRGATIASVLSDLPAESPFGLSRPDDSKAPEEMPEDSKDES